MRVWKDLGLGAGLAQTRTERLGHPYTASVPSPVPGFLNLEVDGLVNLAHGERTVYALASWTTAISNRFDIVVSGGPAFIEVDQDLPVATPVLAPTGIQTLIVSTTRVSESTTGFHATLDFDYVFGQRAGLGALILYAGFDRYAGWDSIDDRRRPSNSRRAAGEAVIQRQPWRPVETSRSEGQERKERPARPRSSPPWRPQA